MALLPLQGEVFVEKHADSRDERKADDLPAASAAPLAPAADPAV